jgi:hypothetical protein
MAVSRARFLTPQEVTFCGCRHDIYRLIKSGTAYRRVSKAYRILEDDVDAYLADRFTQAG